MEGNHRSLKIFLAVFAGGLIGGLICRHFGFPFWFIGLPIGGLIGYLAYSPLAVLKAIPGAWHATRYEMRLSGQFVKKNWRTILLIFLAGELGFFWLFLFVYFAGESSKFNAPFWALCMFVSFFLVLSHYVLSCSMDMNIEKTRREYKFFITHLNPISLVVYTIPLYVFLATRYVIKDCWHHRRVPLVAGRFLGIFVWKLALIIHSEERLLCGVDAAIGATLVFFLHYSPLIGALLGALFGVINFEILSKRVLKVAPTKAH